MKRFLYILLIIGLSVGILMVSVVAWWSYTKIQLHRAGVDGIYATAAEGMEKNIAENYIEPSRYHILYSGPNSFDGSNPHVWYVIACVWGEYRANGSPVGSYRHDYDQPGSYYLNTKVGWVHVREGAFPVLIGFWMKVFNLAGQGSSQPTHDWVSDPHGECTFE
jgi:hypothetical protein